MSSGISLVVGAVYKVKLKTGVMYKIKGSERNQAITSPDDPLLKVTWNARIVSRTQEFNNGDADFVKKVDWELEAPTVVPILLVSHYEPKGFGKKFELIPANSETWITPSKPDPKFEVDRVSLNKVKTWRIEKADIGFRVTSALKDEDYHTKSLTITVPVTTALAGDTENPVLSCMGVLHHGDNNVVIIGKP